MGQNRCSYCTHFASLEAEEPDIESYDYSDGTVEMDVRIWLSTECCSAPAKEYTFNFAESPGGEHGPLDLAILKKHKGKKHGISITDESAENTSRTQPGRVARYTKHFYGVKVTYALVCDCGERLADDLELSDEVEAGAMDKIE